MADSLLSLFTSPFQPKWRNDWSERFARLARGIDEWESYWRDSTRDPEGLLAQNERGQNLAHLAVLWDRQEALEFLPDYLMRKRDVRGISPLDLADLLGREPFIRFWKGSGERQVSIAHPERMSEIAHWPHVRFEDAQLLDEIADRTAQAKEQDEIPAEKIWMGVFFEQEIAEGAHPAVSIRWVSDAVGLGVFAGQPIPACSYVGEYAGLAVRKTRKNSRQRTYCVRYTTWGKGAYLIDAETGGNFTRFCNHSARPNMALQSVYCRGMPRMILLSLRPIAEGEQLTFDYGAQFWKELDQTPVIL